MQDPDDEIPELNPLNILEKNGLKPIIYDGYCLDRPEDFNTVIIYLDARLNSPLDWAAAVNLTEKAISKGFAILFELNFGFFSDLELPLESAMQLNAFKLAINHFKQVFWLKYAQNIIGVLLYRGSADFRQGFSWSETRLQEFKEWTQNSSDGQIKVESLSAAEIKGFQLAYCRDIYIEYILTVAEPILDQIPVYIFLDALALSLDLKDHLTMFNPVRYEYLQLAVKDSLLPLETMRWRGYSPLGYVSTKKLEASSIVDPNIAICLPPLETQAHLNLDLYVAAIKHMQRHNLPFKLISEEFLIHQWDGLDYILYSGQALSPQGVRKMQGFCAAGGCAVSLESTMKGFAIEKTFSEWVIKNN